MSAAPVSPAAVTRSVRAEAPNADEHAAFAPHARELLAGRIEKSGLYLILVTILFWPTDYLFHAAQPEVIRDLMPSRAGALGICLAVLALARFTPLVRSFPGTVGLATSTLGFFIVGWSVSPLGGPGTHYFATLYFCSSMAILAAIPLRPFPPVRVLPINPPGAPEGAPSPAYTQL